MQISSYALGMRWKTTSRVANMMTSLTGSHPGNARIADEEIPSDLDILVTHYPPLGILDQDLGSPEILNFVLKAKPKHHIFGHIHATEGHAFQLGGTLCQNISVFNQLS